MNPSRAPAVKRGFTLVEMLVVMLIIGIIAGLVSVIARPDDRALLDVEAQRLAQLLELAASEAQLGGQTIAWAGTASGYRFLRLNAQDGWNEIRDNDTLRARELPAGMQLAAVAVANRAQSDGLHLEFSPYAPPLAFSVEMTDGAARATIAGSAMGDVQVVRRDE
jgi:general secretion pathway protein H